MLLRFTHLIYLILVLIDKFIKIFAKKFHFILFLKEYIENKSYKLQNIAGNKVKFFIPNKSVNLRVERIFSKEPELLNGLTTLRIIKILYFGI